ncbi:MAG: DNA polymerase III subunit alpha, partial [Myxococcales bacterium]|nr:DNA polymerase III subunit alpha [Myxococcales bacterium]
REVQTRSGKGPMCFFQLEDQLGRIECVCFPKTYARVDEESGLTFGERLEQIGDEPVFATGKIELDKDDEGEISAVKMLLEDVRPIAEVRAERTRQVLLTLKAEQLTPARIFKLKEIVAHHSGTCTMEMVVTVDGRYASKVVFGDKFGVRADEGLMLALERLFGGSYARLV